MGLGSDLMQFFAYDGAARQVDPPLTMKDFHEMHEQVHPYPSMNLRACLRLCDAGRLYQTGLGIGMPVVGNTYAHLQSVADLEAEVRYGTYDFIVEGMPAVRDRLGPSVAMIEVQVDGEPRQGTAFALAPRLMMTARHCVERAGSITVHTSSGAAVTVEQVVKPEDARFDLATLVLAAPIAAQSFQGRVAVPLEPVVTMGYPRLQGMHPALVSSVGEVSGTAESYLDGRAYWITTCAMTGGSSGGPVVGGDGRVVGVVSAFPASDSGIDRGRFGIMTPIADAPPEFLRRSFAASGLDG